MDGKRHLGKPVGGLVAIAAILAIELLFCCVSEPLTGIPFFQPTADDATVVAKRRLAERTGCSVVLIGDSSCTMGLIPQVIEKETNCRVVNLGFLASFSMAGFTATTEELLERPVLPSAVVLAVLPAAFGFTEDEIRKFDLLGRSLVAYDRSSPVYSRRLSDWCSWFYKKHRINRFPPEFGGSFSAFSNQLSETNGFMAETHIYHGQATARREFRASSFTKDSLRKLVRSAEAKGVPVFFWWSPTPADAVTPSYLAAAHATARDLHRELPWLQVLQEEAPAWDVHLFGSVTHLNRAGAAENSKKLAVALRTNLEKSVTSRAEGNTHR